MNIAIQKKYRIAVGLSGGVDSAVSAHLLKQAGHEVFGLFMRNWEDELSCPAEKDIEDVAIICDMLQIPYYIVDFSEQYYNQVFQELVDGLKIGVTPNPDVLCNREIKFNLFLKKALSLGADKIATGHYCRNIDSRLFKAVDLNKDQSYFLHSISKEALEKSIFPLGSLEKTAVRRIAQEENLIVHNKKDSTGICFIGKRDFREFMKQYIPEGEGFLIDIDSGKKLGTHQGAAFYTIGQRKGLGIGGPGEAFFVVGKNIEKNEVYVGQGEDHPALYADALFASLPHWIDGKPPKTGRKLHAKIRYRQSDQECLLRFEKERLLVEFTSPQRAITPGQSIVFYEQEECLGGAKIIHSCSPAYA